MNLLDENSWLKFLNLSKNTNFKSTISDSYTSIRWNENFQKCLLYVEVHEILFKNTMNIYPFCPFLSIFIHLSISEKPTSKIIIGKKL